jgi:hypothetical protein
MNIVPRNLVAALRICVREVTHTDRRILPSNCLGHLVHQHLDVSDGEMDIVEIQ